MKILIESMTCMTWGELTVRCWREEDTKDYPKAITYNEVAEGLVACNSNDPMVIAEFLLTNLLRMNAVEVLDKYRNGVVLYSNWP